MWVDLSEYDRPDVIKVPMGYSVFFSNVTAAATEEGSISVKESSDYVMTDIRVFTYAYGARSTAAYCKVKLVDNGQGRALWDSPLPAEILSPTGREFSYVAPYRFPGNSRIGVTVVNEHSAASDIWVAVFGFHVYANPAG